MARISVPLTLSEKKALWFLADKERRDPRDQAALIIRDYLRITGYLSDGGSAQGETDDAQG